MGRFEVVVRWDIVGEGLLVVESNDFVTSFCSVFGITYVFEISRLSYVVGN